MDLDQATAANSAATRKPVVLVVEDEWLLRFEIASELEREEWTVLQASTGEGAIALLHTGQHIDTVITDIQLAGKQTGLDVAEAARSADPEMPIVYVSGRSRDAARSVEGSLFFPKPYNVVRIVEAVRDLLRTH